MYYQYEHTTTPSDMASHQRSAHPFCKAKRLLLRDIRPTPNSQSQYLLRKADICPSRCIYCDIWKLALLVYSRQNQQPNSPTSPLTSQQPNSRSSQTPKNGYERAMKSLESAHHVQRTCLSSIISICTVDGAEESEGLRVAHDRCLASVLELLRQERTLQRQMTAQRANAERELREKEREREIREWRESQIREWRERDYGYGYEARRTSATGVESRRASAVSCAM